MRPFHSRILAFAALAAAANAARAGERIAPPATDPGPTAARIESDGGRSEAGPEAGSIDDRDGEDGTDEGPDDERRTPDGDEPADPDGDAGGGDQPPGRVRSFSLRLRSSAASRGEAELEALASARTGPVRLLFGAGGSLGTQAPERRSWLAGVEAGADALSASALLRMVPTQAGESLLAGHLELHAAAGPWSGTLAADAARLSLERSAGPPKQAALGLDTGSLSLELEREFEGGLSLSLRGLAGASTLSLSSRAPPPAVWQLPGLRALQWPLRAAAGAGVRLARPGWAAAAGLSYELPAEQDARALEASLSVEREVGETTLACEFAAAQVWPAGLWLARASLEVRLPLPDPR